MTKSFDTFFVSILVLVFATTVSRAQAPEAQTAAPTAAPDKAPSAETPPLDACGPKQHTKFSVHMNKDQHPTPEATVDKAMVYVIQQPAGPARYVSRSDITAFAVDGKWIGANRGTSYFFFPVEPGDHHVCSFAWVGRIGDDRTRTLLHSLNAETGRTYYFVQKEKIIDVFGHKVAMALELVEAEQAKPLIANSEFATTEVH
ncbi:MAG: hypothetical protein ACRD5M_02685 [Candidatus Acidiferrales bacterium]